MEMMEEEETGVCSHPEVRGDFRLPSNTHPTRCPSRLPVLLCNPPPLLNLPLQLPLASGKASRRKVQRDGGKK